MGRYATIDAWRGLAALGVVLTHVTRNRYGVEHEWRIGHECVLVFFVISGYCVTASAEATRSKGFGDFMRRRVRRIYPPYAFALAFYALTRLLKIALRGGGAPTSWSPLSWVQNLTLTQWLSMLASPGAAPWHNPVNFVPAFWSLQHEEQFYIVSGLLVLATPLFRVWGTLVMMAVSAAWVVGAPYWTPTPYHGLFLEMWVYFGLGVIVFYRLERVLGHALRRTVDVGFAAALAAVAILWLRARAAGTQTEDAWRHLGVVLAFSVALIALRRFDGRISGHRWFRPLLALGAMTYSLYLVHQFNVVAVAEIITSCVPGRWAAVSIAAQTAVHVAIAAAFWRLCERPFVNRSTRAPLAVRN